MSVESKLPDGTVVLQRESAGKSVELARQLADLGASAVLVAAVGGEDALQQPNSNTPQDGRAQPA